MMRSASSLSNRIFLACTLLATLSLGFAFWVVNATATKEAEADLQRGLVDAAELVDEHRISELTYTFRLARLVADLPKLKAGVVTGDLPTVQPLVDDYRTQMNVDLLVVSDRQGQVLGSAGAEGATLPEDPRTRPESKPCSRRTRAGCLLIVVPILLGLEQSELLGRLTAGFFLDPERAQQFKKWTNSEIAFGAGDRIMASSLPPEFHDLLRGALTSRGITSVSLRGEEYLALARPIHPPSVGTASPAEPGPVVLVLRSRTEHLRFLNTIRA